MDVPAIEVVTAHNARSFLRDPANQASGRVAEVAHPLHGHVRALHQLVRVSDAAVPPFRALSPLSSGLDEILSSVGWGGAEVADLRASGVVL